jgi:hypothetical protein
MFRVYSGAPGTETISPLDKHLFKEFSRIEEAIGFAHHLKEKGHVAVLIEGDDGTRLTRADLASVLHRGQQSHSTR